jgi:serine/threonine protein kinase
MSQRDTRLIGGIYRIGQTISSGGMLSIYTAYNRISNDVVGLYVITFAPTTQIGAVQPLLQALEPRRSLQSPHVLRIYNWGIDGNRAYIATDPPRGVTLQHIIDTENIDIPRAIELIRQMAIGVKLLHEKGISGLDLRPQLITVDSVNVTDRVQIDDIGLRSLLHSLGYVHSQQNSDLGYLDPRYAPPEYINSGKIGSWSDVYQLGLLLFELITGRLPFVGRTPAETGIMQNTNSVPRMIQFTHETPEAVQFLVDCALAKDPVHRFANAGALLTALEALQLPTNQPTTESPRPTSGVLGSSFTHEMTSIEEMMTPRTILHEEHSSPAQTSYSTAAAYDVYAYLSFEKEEQATPQRIPLLQKNIIVGRADPKRGYTPDIDLTDFDPKMTVSRQHARIRFEETFFYIEDLKSRNKTRLGELALTPLKAELLQHGDVLHFGSVRMRFEIPGMAQPPVFHEHK